MAQDDELLLNYHDACVYRSDLRLLEDDRAWLNDACINFQITRLSKRARESADQRRPTNDTGDDSFGDDCLFLDPSVVSFVMHQTDDDDLIDLCRSWNLLERKRVLVPVNDNNGASAVSFQTPGGGNHWSLLLMILRHCQAATDREAMENTKHMIPKTAIYFHFDSCRGHNKDAAQAVANRMQRALRLGLDLPTSECASVTECVTPQQSNGYDCGLFTLAAAEALSDPSLVGETSKPDGVFLVEPHEQSLRDLVSERGADFAREMRKTIANDIRHLAKAK